MTNKEAFNTVKDHLLKQQERSTEGGACAYRGNNDLKCAIGCLIKDEEYRPNMEGNTVGELWEKGLLPASINEVDMYVLNCLQTIHDGEEPDYWHEELDELEFDLKSKGIL